MQGQWIKNAEDNGCKHITSVSIINENDSMLPCLKVYECDRGRGCCMLCVSLFSMIKLASGARVLSRACLGAPKAACLTPPSPSPSPLLTHAPSPDAQGGRVGMPGWRQMYTSASGAVGLTFPGWDDRQRMGKAYKEWGRMRNRGRGCVQEEVLQRRRREGDIFLMFPNMEDKIE